jgi:hypothetical protein
VLKMLVTLQVVFLATRAALHSHERGGAMKSTTITFLLTLALLSACRQPQQPEPPADPPTPQSESQTRPSD